MTPSDVARSYLAAFATRDVDAISGHVAASFHNQHASALGTESVGIHEYRERLPGFLAMFPELRYEVEYVVESGERAMATYRLVGTHDDHPIEIRGVMSFVVRNGLIESRVDYWDALTFLRQTDQA